MQFTFFHASGREDTAAVKPNEMGFKKVLNIITPTRQRPLGRAYVQNFQDLSWEYFEQYEIL